MAADTRNQTSAKFRQAMDSQSNNPEVDPAEARASEAEAFANAVFDAMIGRKVTVQGVTSDGATFSVQGTIIE